MRAPCGTYAGWSAHYRRREIPCRACCDARRNYYSDKKHAPQRRAVLAEAVGHGSYGGIAGGS